MSSLKRTFHQELVLNQWVLSLFGMSSIHDFKNRFHLDRAQYEGLDEDGSSIFYRELKHGELIDFERITEDDLLRYDLNIVKYWSLITEKRNREAGQTLHMKYFQYLSLLFTEIYLDWYFHRPEELLHELNTQRESHNEDEKALQLAEYTTRDLSKIAFWSATGSGKTLLLHVNIHQYLHYYKAKTGRNFPDKIIVLTPNEGLSHQHVEELQLSGFHAELFNKDQSLPNPGAVDVIDIHKLGDRQGDKTVDASSFEGDNLVLVDEGHRGTSSYGGKWLERREQLVSKGFAFEYSATFGQAVGSNNKERRAVERVYAKCILFDYSYKYFYDDGYGKDALILNMDRAHYEEHGSKYFTACLLSFFQQQWLWREYPHLVMEYSIAKPLWVFVGHTVTGGKITSNEDKSTASDVLKVVNFLGWFLNNPEQVKPWLEEFIKNDATIVNSKNISIFHDRFTALKRYQYLGADALYRDILKHLFNTNSRQRLRLVNLKGSDGELALCVGNAKPFGLINIGDDAGLFQRASEYEQEFETARDDFGTGLFETINQEDSELHVLIGAKKFTEGWSSWRVSTMGLLNIGQSKGAQIIQMFGRGVRLKGKDFSLKRTTPLDRKVRPLKNTHFEKLETLNIFGVGADYMNEFKQYLHEEGLPDEEEILEINFSTAQNRPAHKLITLQLKDGYKDNQRKGFKRKNFPALYEIPDAFKGKIKDIPQARLDMYPRVKALQTRGAESTASDDRREQHPLNISLFPFFDWDRIFLEIHHYKLERSWSNLRLDKKSLRRFCEASQRWYTLYIPKEALKITSFQKVRYQEDILIQLLKTYTHHFYNTLKLAYEGQFMETTFIENDHPSLLSGYMLEFEKTAVGKAHHDRFQELQKIVEDKDLQKAAQWGENADRGIVAISFKQHLYYPLLAILDSKDLPIKIRPMAFDSRSEVDFIRNLEEYYQSKEGKQQIGHRSLYLLRNPSNRKKGLGFTLAGSFYPDYLLWLVDPQSNEQWLSFIDPKGLRNMNLIGATNDGPAQDPKLGLYKEIKHLEHKLNADKGDDTRLHLNSFILSATDFNELINTGDFITEKALEEMHVFFMRSDVPIGSPMHYLTRMFDRILA